MNPSGKSERPRFILLAVLFVATAVGMVLTAWLLTTIFDRKQEAKNPYIKLVEVDENTTDPEVWGKNFPSQYDGYKRTVDATRTRFGGSEALPESKLERDPWLKRMFLGYAFSIDYRDRRGHAYMLYDQEQTQRVLQRPQPGACLHCHSSVMPLYRHLGDGDVIKGFELANAMTYQEAHDALGKSGQKLVEHPVSCVDCHDPKTMHLRVTRPGFINGIKALKASQGIKDYDVNRDATRQEMRTYACAQCHVEYYFKGKEKMLTYPWSNGIKVEEIEKYYDDEGWTDYKHAETGTPILKAQHPEFELWSQGIHARSGVSCADCHMPYMREGAMKVSDHHVRSPLLNVARACQQCHHYSEEEIKARADTIQTRTHDLMQRAATALMEMMDAIAEAKKAGASESDLKSVLALHRKAQWRLDFIAAENSMGFHASQEAARILGEAIDYARQAQAKAHLLRKKQ
ncbi:MAG TPA: ammonia-forming cytochrome c nitrite reductase subunit c552 [Planctomycetota bacterium]|nr:ammonia-forming cytochrome c nitrite reductase subunit c552 [Planctomycetota bacterium]